MMTSTTICKSRIRKLILLALVATVMLTLCACRTRLSNNNEVSNVYYDEEGYLQEAYQARRDELNLSTAKKPILPSFGNTDDEEDYDTGDTGEVTEIDPDEFQEDIPTPTPTPSPRTSRRSTIRHSYNYGTNGESDDDEDDNKEILVSFDSCGGTKIVGVLKVKTGGTYGNLQEPKRDGYKFKGWYTKKDGGTKIENGTKVTETKNHTLYAHWEEEEPKKEEPKKEEPKKDDPKKDDPKKDDPKMTTYKVIFVDGDGKVISDQDIEEGKSAEKPEDPSSPDPRYRFKDWDKDYNNITSEITISPIWEIDPVPYWNHTKPNMTEDQRAVCFVDGNSDEVKECNGKIASSDTAPADINIALAYADDEEEATRNKETLSAQYPDARILVVSKPPTDDTSPEMLVYRLALHEALYPDIELDSDSESVAEELGLDKEKIFKIY